MKWIIALAVVAIHRDALEAVDGENCRREGKTKFVIRLASGGGGDMQQICLPLTMSKVRTRKASN